MKILKLAYNDPTRVKVNKKFIVMYRYKNERQVFLLQLWPDLLIMFKWSNTYHEANILPLVHLLRCLMRPITLSGGSVRA